MGSKMMKTWSIRFLLGVCLAFGYCGIPAFAQQAVSLPDLTSKRLLNGLQIYIASTPNFEEMTIGLVTRYGSAFDPTGKEGLANLMTRLFGRATVDKTAKEIQEELAGIGATLNVSCDWDGCRFVLRGRSALYERSLLILFQVAAEAQWLQSDLDEVKKEMLSELEQPADPRQKIRYQFDSALFKGTTYGRPIRGTRESLGSITLGDVKAFYRKYFSPRDSSLVVAGNVTPAVADPKITRIWGVWVRGDEVPFTFLPPTKPSGLKLYLEDDPASPAAQFIMGNLWPRREEPVFYQATLAARVLQDRLNGALPTSLLTVDAEGRRLAGRFYIQGQAAADQAAAQIVKIIDVVREFKIGQITAQEVDAARKSWIEEFNRSLGTSIGYCNAMLDEELYRLGINYSAMLPDLLGRIDVNLVRQAANDYMFPAGEIIMLRGPASILKPELEPLGPINLMVP